MNKMNFLKLTMIGLTAGLFISAQAASTHKESTAPKKDAVVVEKKEADLSKKELTTDAKAIVPAKDATVDNDVVLPNKETADKKEVAMTKCSKESDQPAGIEKSGKKYEPVQKCDKCEKQPKCDAAPKKDSCSKPDSGCGCEAEKIQQRKGAAREAVGK